MLSVSIREKTGDSIIGDWVADIVAGIAGNIGGTALGGLTSNYSSDVGEIIENAPGVAYDISDTTNDNSESNSSIVLDSYGYPYTGEANGKEYYNGIELVDGLKLGYGVNGELIPIPIISGI